MAGKQYEVVRPFRRVDPESGDVTHHEPGDSYSGPMEIEEHYIGNDGPDGRGPLVVVKPETAEAVVEQDKSGQQKAPAAPAALTPGASSKGGK